MTLVGALNRKSEIIFYANSPEAQKKSLKKGHLNTIVRCVIGPQKETLMARKQIELVVFDVFHSS